MPDFSNAALRAAIQAFGKASLNLLPLEQCDVMGIGGFLPDAGFLESFDRTGVERHRPSQLLDLIDMPAAPGAPSL